MANEKLRGLIADVNPREIAQHIEDGNLLVWCHVWRDAASSCLDTVPVVEVVHGSWIEDDPCASRYCSVCEFNVHDDASFELYGDYLIKPNYCPNCGAKMDGAEETCPAFADRTKFAELVRSKDVRRE